MGAETQRPIAVVIVTGTLSACALALIVLPVLYSVWIRKAPASLALEDDVRPEALT
jgi:cobalt-zinc-cadmium resistance protein CzcA